MSPKQWFALLCFYFAYLWAGGSLYYHIEHQVEAELREEKFRERRHISGILTKCLENEDEITRTEIFEQIGQYCGKPVTNYTQYDLDLPFQWTYYHAIQFAFIACTTIGYGNITPRTPFGQIFCIFYTLIGIPINAIVFAVLGDYFGQAFTGAYKRYKEYKRSHDKNYVPRQLGLFGQYILYLVPGMVLLIFLPAVWFSYFEDWSYVVSVYYAYITLTTIGFGDFVASFKPEQPEKFGIWFVFYEVFMIVWIIFGLGYLVMIVTFLVKGMQSKRVKQMEHQLSENIKATQQRIWTGVSKDIGYLRRFINEMYMLRFKAVYNEPGEKVEVYNVKKRSSSCPDLSMYRSHSPLVGRKRAFSEYHIKPLDSDANNTMGMQRVQSDTDLSRIDKKRTFEQNDAMMKNGELLARVVTALGNMRASEDGLSLQENEMGQHGFSDSQILASERSLSKWSLAPSERSYAHPPQVTRSRAASDFMAIPPNINIINVNERTWSGENSPTFHLSRDNSKRKDNMFRNAFPLRNRLDSNRSNRSAVLGQDQPPEPVPRAVNYSLIEKLNPFRQKRLYSDSGRKNSLTGQDMMDTTDIFMEPTDRRRGSNVSLARQYLEATAKGRQSMFSVISHTDDPNRNVLESTTIADLIRALEVVHTQANIGPDINLTQNNDDAPKRKLGTASLTPPKISPLMTLFPPPNELDGTGARRGSLRPVPGYTTVFNSNNMQQASRKQSIPRPPPYTTRESPRPPIRKFSVRPTNLSIPPGQAPSVNTNPSIQASSSLQRKLSVRPSPLTRDTATDSSGRYTRSSTPSKANVPPVQPRNSALLRPALMQASRSRHGSLSELYSRHERKRTESK